MNIKINAQLDNKELLEHFVGKLNENGIDASKGTFKFEVQNKANEWVEVSQEKVRITFSN